jgi:hypothetical protein
MMIERLTMPDEYSLEKIIPYLETEGVPNEHAFADSPGEWVLAENTVAPIWVMESTPAKGFKESFYEKWRDALLNGSARIREDFHKEYYCDMPDSMLVNDIIPGSSKDIQLKKLCAEIKNLTLHYQWEYVGIEEESRIYNSWMLQIFIDKIQEFQAYTKLRGYHDTLNRMVEFVREKKFYTHDMEREFEVIEFEAMKENARITGHFHKPTWTFEGIRGMQIQGALLDDAFSPCIQELQEDPPLRAFTEAYGVLIRPASTVLMTGNAIS